MLTQEPVRVLLGRSEHIIYPSLGHCVETGRYTTHNRGRWYWAVHTKCITHALMLTKSPKLTWFMICGMQWNATVTIRKKEARSMTAAQVERAGVTKESFEAWVGPHPGLEEGSPIMNVWQEIFQKGPSQAKAWRQDCAWSGWRCDKMEGPRSPNQEEKWGMVKSISVSGYAQKFGSCKWTISLSILVRTWGPPSTELLWSRWGSQRTRSRTYVTVLYGHRCLNPSAPWVTTLNLYPLERVINWWNP